jgi:hypothetical protein
MLSFSLQSIQDRVDMLINTTNVRNFQAALEISEELPSNRPGKHEESGIKYHLYQKGYWTNSDLSLRVGAKEWPANFSENQAESADRLEERAEVKDRMKAAFVGIMAVNHDAGIR